MTHAALMLAYNNLELTKRAIESVKRQDIPVELLVIDDASTDGTHEWLASDEFSGISLSHSVNKCFTASINEGLSYWFNKGEPYVLMMSNDIVLSPWYYRELLTYDIPLVSGYTTEDINEIASSRPVFEPKGGASYGALLVRREAWDVVGVLDENMKFYASDCDYAVRAHRAGVRSCHVNLPYYHAGSSTLKNSLPDERHAIEAQAGKDIEEFARKWGYFPGSLDWQKLFAEEFFGIDRKKREANQQ